MHSNILCIIAHDKGLRFLSKAISELVSALNSSDVFVDATTLYPNNASLQKCIDKIQALPLNSEVIFFLHGGNGYISASSVGTGQMPSGGEISITSDLCCKKDCIVVACDSNSRTIERFKNNGALSAIGFGFIDFACSEFYDRETLHKTGKRPTRERFSKYMFRKILVQTIIHVEQHDLSFKSFKPVFHFLCNYYIDDLLLNSTIDQNKVTLSWKKRIIVSRFLQTMKEGVKVL